MNKSPSNFSRMYFSTSIVADAFPLTISKGLKLGQNVAAERPRIARETFAAQS